MQVLIERDPVSYAFMQRQKGFFMEERVVRIKTNFQ